MDDNRYYCIYIAVNRSNGKMYIGKTCMGVDRRWFYHLNLAKSGGKTYFSRALLKHGEDSFIVNVLEDGLNREEANTREKLWISIFGSTKPEVGYNSTLGGDGGVQTDSVRQKMSAAKKGRPLTWVGSDKQEEVLKKLSETKLGPKNPNYGKPSPFRKEIPKEEVISSYLEGKSSAAIGSMFGVSSGIVLKRLKEWDVPIRNQVQCQTGSISWHYGRKRTPEQRETMRKANGTRRKDVEDANVVDLYTNEGLSTIEIGKIVGMTCTAVRRRLTTNNVVLRSVGRNARNR